MGTQWSHRDEEGTLVVVRKIRLLEMKGLDQISFLSASLQLEITPIENYSHRNL